MLDIIHRHCAEFNDKHALKYTYCSLVLISSICEHRLIIWFSYQGLKFKLKNVNENAFIPLI